jgi:hypothetical protein
VRGIGSNRYVNRMELGEESKEESAAVGMTIRQESGEELTAKGMSIGKNWARNRESNWQL